jgi:hypothetical protein
VRAVNTPWKPLTQEQTAKVLAEFGAFMRAKHEELRAYTDDDQIRQAFPEIWTGWAMRFDFEIRLAA